MRQISVQMLLTIFTWLVGSVMGVKGADDIRAQELAELTQSDRVAVMRALLERRIDKLRNIEVSSETRLVSREWLDGRLGNRLLDGGWWQFHTLHRDGSYRVTSTWFKKDTAKQADSTAVSHYDVKTGVIRTTSKGTKESSAEGRIGNEHLPSLLSNRVAYHLLAGSYVSRPFADKCEFVLPSLHECSDKWSVDVNVQSQEAAIRHPYRIAFVNTGGWGVRRVFFDIARGMLPVRIEVDYNVDLDTKTGAMPIWREERIIMGEPKKFDDLWMATRIEERVRTGKDREKCQVFLTKVSRFDFGGVRKTDLEVKFPAGTKVADTLKNVWYFTGLDGEPKGQVHPIGPPKGTLKRDSQGQVVLIPEESKPGWILHVGIWAIGVGSVLLLSLFGLKKYLTRKAIVLGQ